MKIKDIHIYGFGKLENFILKDISRFAVFYGENEAGKSTIMAFIHGVLFGFPTKLHAEQRYEPKTHAKYGGKLTLCTDSGNSFTVERIKGKAAGDVTVLYEDGSIGGEKELKEELNGIDKSSFQGIYSFNIHGLQEISRLKEEEINRYLFSSGMTGTDALFKLEEQWQKELDRLFKKTGKKPEINQKLTDLKQIESQLKKAKEKNESYTLLVQEKNKSEESLSALHEEKETKEKQLKQVEELENSWLDLIEYKDIKKKLKEMESVTSFPVDGMVRLEKWQNQSSQQTSALEVTRSRLLELDKKIEESEPNWALTERTPLLNRVMEKRELYTKWQDRAADHEQLSRQLTAKMSQLIRELDIENVESINTVNLDIVMKDKVKSIEETLNKLQMKKESLRDSIRDEQNQISYLEERCEELEEKLLEESEFQDMQKSVRENTDLDTLKIQYELVRGQLNERKDNDSKEKNQLLPKLVGTAFALITGFLVWSLTESLLPAAVTLIVVLAASMVLLKFQDKKEDSSYWLKLENKAGMLQEKIQQLNQSDDEIKKIILREQTELRKTWKQWILKLENSEHTLGKLQEEDRNLQNQEKSALEDFLNIVQDLQLPAGLHWKLLGEAFEKLKELMKIYEENQNAKEVYRHCQEKISLYEKEIAEAVEGLPLNFTSIEETLIRIKDALLTNERKVISFEEFKKQREEAAKEYNLVKAQVNTSNSEITKLLNAAEVKDEEEFRQKAAALKEKRNLEQQEKIMFNRLGKDLLSAFYDFKENEADIKLLKTKQQKTIAELKQKTNKENEKLAEILYEISVLEEGESYTRLLYRFHEEKAVLNELSREWMKYSLARSALKNTIEEYKKDKLPRVIQTAEKYLETLTNGHYTKILSPQSEQYFTIQRRDGITFTPDELSQGTKEQVYISLRFALVKIMKGVYSLPVIIDDGFVNFDEVRTEAVLKLLQQFKEETQVLFFTCHPHILKNIKSTNVIHLGDQQRESLTPAGNITR